MLRRGVWDGGVGSHDIPAPLAALDPRRWPSDGWKRLRLLRDRIEIEPVVVDAGRQPEFLASIVAQVERRDASARYLIDCDGETYEYLLGEFGWSSRIEAIADLDGDGKPDFIIKVDGNNSGDEVVLLSSRARPGRNAATARLHVTGC